MHEESEADFSRCVPSLPEPGHGRERILAGDKDKTFFPSILGSASKRLRIRVLAYYLMDSHYHLVIENSSGRMADFFSKYVSDRLPRWKISDFYQHEK